MKDIQSQSRKYLIKHEDEWSKSNYNFTATAAQTDCENVLAVFRGFQIKYVEMANKEITGGAILFTSETTVWYIPPLKS